MRVFGWGHMMLVCVVEWVHVIVGRSGRWVRCRLCHPGLFSLKVTRILNPLVRIVRRSCPNRYRVLLCKPEEGPEVESKFGLSAIGGRLDK